MRHILTCYFGNIHSTNILPILHLIKNKINYYYYILSLRRIYNYIILFSMAKQLHKAIYFDDYQGDNGKNKSFTIAFGEDENTIYERIRSLSSYEIKSLLGYDSYKDLKADAEADGRPVNQFAKRILAKKIKTVKKSKIQSKDVTFENSKEIPFQRWYPYIEGYSPNFVKSLIGKYCSNATLIYEPFAGTGTTLFSADLMGVDTVYSEVNPLLRCLIDAKVCVMKLNTSERKCISEKLIAISRSIINESSLCAKSKELEHNYSTVFGKSVYFPEDQLTAILKLRTYIDTVRDAGDILISKLLDVAVFSSLIPVSYLKKQGDLRFKTEKEKLHDVHTIQELLPNKIVSISEDVANIDYRLERNHLLATPNAKLISTVDLGEKVSAVITSPPYLNGTNYFRNTKLELWFLSYLKSEKDLRTFRDEALTSGINDVKLGEDNQNILLHSALLRKTINALNDKAYDRRIPVMAKCYFAEMYQIFDGLRQHLRKNAILLIDIGDSIFSGVHIKTDRILAEVAFSLGFILEKKVLLRQRRSRNGELLSQVLLVIRYIGE